MNKELREFISKIENDGRREDSETLLKIMKEESGYQPYLAGSMIGFGRYHYRYESGREGDFFVTGFAPRKQKLAIYIIPGFSA